MLGISGGHLVVCGGWSENTGTDRCEVFDQEQGIWMEDNVKLLSGKKGWFPSVQLDDDRIWMGRESGGKYIYL